MNLRDTFNAPKVARVELDGMMIRWELAGRKSTVKLKRNDFIRNLANLQPGRESYIQFIEKYGAVWGGRSIHLIDVANRVRFFRLMHYLLGNIKEEGQPELAAEMEQTFFAPLANWEKNWNEVTRGYNYIIPAGYSLQTLLDGLTAGCEEELDYNYVMVAWEAFSEWGWTSGLTPPKQRRKQSVLYPLIGNNPQEGLVGLYPVDPKGDFWPTFEKPPELKNWEERKRWLHQQLITNALTLLRNNIDLRLYVNKGKGCIEISAVSKDAYTWAVALLVIAGPRQCLLCGKLTGGRKYCSPRCTKEAMSTWAKQDFLDYLGRQHRGHGHKLTDDEHEYAKKRTIFWFEQLDEEKYPMLKDEVLADIMKQWPARDFSFLNGYGTRRDKRNKKDENARHTRDSGQHSLRKI